MSKLIQMEDAARLLGMSVERLTELRSNNEVFGYRDGSTWKFKMTELERVAGELGVEISSPDVSDDSSPKEGESSAGASGEPSGSAKDMLLDDGEMDSVELMEDSSAEIFSEPKKAPSKADFKDDSIDLDGDDDVIDLVDSGRLSQRSPDASGSMNFGGSSGILASEGNVIDDDEDDEELSFGSSSIRLASESSGKLKDEAADDPGQEAGKQPAADDTGKFADEDLSLSEDELFSDELSISDDSSFEESSELSSDFEDSDDLVLEDSDSSTEITLEKNESGINLSANESGISLLDEPLELGGSDIDALELPEDDDMIVLDDAVSPDQPTMMQEDDFNLTPLADSLEEDDSSGSQVIALEDSEIYADDSAGAILGEDEFEAQPAMLDDTMGGDFGGGYDEGAVMPGQMMTSAGPAALPEAPYTMWQVISLGLVATMLLTGGMVAYNLAQNMWMPEDQIIGSSVLNFFLDLTGMNHG